MQYHYAKDDQLRDRDQSRNPNQDKTVCYRLMLLFVKKKLQGYDRF